MRKEQTRRAVLKHTVAGTGVLASVSPTATTTRAAQSEPRGEIVDVHGNPVEDARVTLFATGNRTKIDETTTGPEGVFSLSVSDLPSDHEALLIARKKVVNELAGAKVRNDWFTTHVFPSSGRVDLLAGQSLGRIALDKELLVFPTNLVDRTTGSGREIPLGVASVWRHVGNPYNSTDPDFPGLHSPTDQIYSIEVTNVAVGSEDNPDPYKIHHKFPTGGNYDLKNGVFSLTFPEDDVVVDYGSQDDLALADGVVVRGAETNSVAESREGTLPTAAWHPLRTDLPAYESCRKLRKNRYAQMSTADAESLNRIEKALGIAAGLIPGVGEFQDIVELLSDDSAQYTADLTLPVPPAARNENEFDTARLAWQSDNTVTGLYEASVVLRVPVRFQYEEERRSQFVAQSTWNVPGLVDGLNSGRARIQTVHARGPFGHIGEQPSKPSDDPSTTPDDSGDSGGTGEWPLYQVDQRNTGYDPDATGPTGDVGPRWTLETGSKVMDAPAVADGTVYAVSDSSKLHVVDAATGEPLDEGEWPVEVQAITSPAVADGTVYVGTIDNFVYALDAASGAKQWEFEASDAVFTPPTVVGDTVYVGSWDGKVYALAADSGDLRDGDWPAETERYIVDSSPAVANGTLYVGDNSQGEEPIGGSVYALDADSGAPVDDGNWPVETDGEIYSSPAVVDGTVYVGSLDGNVYALDAESGSEQWTAGVGKVYGSPVVADGTVYAGSLDGNVYALDAASGEQVSDGNWPVETGGRVWASPSAAGDTVYAGSADNSVYALDAASGEERWSFEAGGTVRTSPAVAGGTVYVGSMDGTVYALAEGESQGNGTDGGTSTSTEGFEDGTVDGWSLREDQNDALTAEENSQMGGSWVALLETSPPDSGTGNRPQAYRNFEGTLSAGTTLEATVWFSQRQPGHVPQIKYRSSGETRNMFRLRFDPPVDNVWCHVRRGDTRNRDNFASQGAPKTVYRVEFTLREDSVACELFDGEGTSLASTTVDHPDGFTYDAIDQVVVESREPVDIRFDDISVPTG